MQRFQQMVERQNGKFVERLPLCPATEFRSDRSGTLTAIDGQLLGQAVIALGGGRRELADPVDHEVGFEMLVRLGRQDSKRSTARKHLRPQQCHIYRRRYVAKGDFYRMIEQEVS